MQSDPANPVSSRRWSVWRWLAVVLGGCVLIVAIGVVNVFTLSRDAAALRRELFAAMHTRADPRVQIDVGPGLLTLARGVVGLIDDVPPEAHRALRAVRAASVGVYHLREATDPQARTALLQAADRAMDRRAWVRIVGVNNAHETVLIYMPVRRAWLRNERVCLAVCRDRELVIVSAAVDAEKLIEFIHDKQEFAGFKI